MKSFRKSACEIALAGAAVAAAGAAALWRTLASGFVIDVSSFWSCSQAEAALARGARKGRPARVEGVRLGSRRASVLRRSTRIALPVLPEPDREALETEARPSERRLERGTVQLQRLARVVVLGEQVRLHAVVADRYADLDPPKPVGRELEAHVAAVMERPRAELVEADETLDLLDRVRDPRRRG